MYYLGEMHIITYLVFIVQLSENLVFISACGPLLQLKFLTTKDFAQNFVFKIGFILLFLCNKTCNEKFVSAVKKVCQPRLVLIRQINSRFKFVNSEHNTLFATSPYSPSNSPA